ncbi:MAG: LysM peptidoglycan-binding domain-containing protein [Bradyrhizobium sp.]|uniref:LysM peptidoglycan-binding domain-containing protein n=1 Tax=Bradyrhizobium sp. TaxID=376 RepID=UPI001D49316F|nr:LysM peptidoglycan-binding domain-containing protein [Bradyrhizobium sp.]MBV9565987.1 LysM peptidoglycan-binding domain-containing protein [Bradyrhizobium sp.]
MNVLLGLSMSRIVVSLVAMVAVAGAAQFLVGGPFFRHAPSAEVEKAGGTADAALPMVSKQVPAALDRGTSPLTAAERQANDLAALLGPSPAPAADDGVPAFDVVTIDPNGEAVIAGRATPGATVELLRNGEPHARVVADPSGQFAMTPHPLPGGTYDLTLRVRRPDGSEVTSKQSVAVALESAKDRPTVALMTPDKPTVVLSKPADAAETVRVDAVDIGPGGKLSISGHARPGATVRLYLNDSFVAAATAGADGRLAITINEGAAPGNYRVRLDEMAASSGTVRARAEVPFDVPETTTGAVPAQTPAPSGPELAAAGPPQLAAAPTTVPSDGGSPSAVVVPKIATVAVSRGDSLWHISRRALGVGERYAVIFRANRKQIRDPNLIYPGQVFVVPARR